MIEAIGEEIDALLDPLLSRAFKKQGNKEFVALGAEQVEVDPKFRMYLQTKLINPHYKPETAAQCTIINFLVTEKGLGDQLLASVVRKEKPEIEQQKDQLTADQNAYKIQLEELEADLLEKLAAADMATILDNLPLIEGLEKTKATSTEIKQKQEEAVVAEKRINELRENYRIVADEGAMLYFMLLQLSIVEHMYQYSLKTFEYFFFKAIERTEVIMEGENEEETGARSIRLRQNIREQIYQWVSRGLFVRHKQIL